MANKHLSYDAFEDRLMSFDEIAVQKAAEDAAMKHAAMQSGILSNAKGNPQQAKVREMSITEGLGSALDSLTSLELALGILKLRLFGENDPQAGKDGGPQATPPLKDSVAQARFQAARLVGLAHSILERL